MIRNAVNSAIQNKNIVMFITAVIFIIGVASYYNNCAIPCAAMLAALGIFAAAKNYFSLKYIVFWLFMFYFGFFNAYFRTNTTDVLVPFAPRNAVIEGQIVTVPKAPRFFFHVDLIDGQDVDAKTIVTIINQDFSQYEIGKSYRLTGRLSIPAKAGNPSQFDYRKYLRNFDTFTTFYAEETVALERELTPRWQFMNSLNNLRSKIIATHARYIQSPNLEVLGGIVFGDDAVQPAPEIKNSFKTSGLLHILAASGMNVAFIYGFWFFFLSKLRAPYRFTVISGVFLVVLYTLMTGLGPSIIRAALMLIIILIGKLIDRDTHSVSLLSFVALLMLIYNPAFLNDVGFQLSFVVTFGLLTTGNIIFERLKNVPGWLSGSILIPIIAQIWIMPIQTFYFNTISTYSVLANILSVPILSIVSFGGFTSSIIAMFTNRIGWLDFVLNYATSAIVFISDFFSRLPDAIITTTEPALWRIFIYYALVTCATLLIKGFNRRLAAVCVVFLLLLVPIKLPDKNLKIIAFDVQNADMFLVKTPENKYFMIDTGKSGYNTGSSKAKYILLPYLIDHGIKNIESIVITHFDNDHSGGTVDILEGVNVKQVYLNSYDDKSYTSRQIYAKLRNSALARNNEVIYEEPELSMTTFIAPRNPKARHDNERSIITLLSYKDFDMLFTGDAGVEAFEKLNIPSGVEVLKVGHHGGNDAVNTKMLGHLGTAVSVISTGTNPYGHPAKSTLDILSSTDIYRTDLDNSVKIVTDGKIYKVYTYDIAHRKYILNRTYVCPSNSTAQDISSNFGSR